MSVTSTNLALTIGYVQMGFGIAVIPIGPAMAARWRPAQHGRVEIRDVRKIFDHEQIIMLHRVGGHELQHLKQFRETVLKQNAAGKSALSPV